MQRNDQNVPWYREGQDPDYRFSLANERTFLAWVRTVLALLATVVVIEQIATHAVNPAPLKMLCVALSLTACIAGGACYFRWKANEVAMRHARSLPSSILQSLLGTAIFCVSVTVTVLLSI
ncbi:MULTISPECIES: YidH family protein [Cupriavidus]|jgi:putative membrane protein|uniref:DUF202 domain-containing protein n=1 Tax=Cupriavidus campinensis TaxID=151783 RepID=A0AAE9I286_9BURK|nr:MULTISPECIES: DUF202 domain-containing protein [Cupriavidus]MCA3188374.1 DUF202 domain-containing protein [Cupriavidus sp.]MCA3192144.1 DUF202 domain-containing protein [Cupriavidus sp.]MCA3197889.1 DUF202 domain-containing protein [Cupriavidus sp.]MCA3202942.1 DUF202 domain-containing protein [Cupriavidus sp.]MCA3232948.1 DUF202 domain-containing protein [Cupriavidus sp.]